MKYVSEMADKLILRKIVHVENQSDKIFDIHATKSFGKRNNREYC